MNNFDKTHRLLKKSEYDHVFDQAKKLATPFFTILYRDNTIGHARLGLALSKKMIAKSHDRNRVKRLVRETFRTTPTLLSFDIIVLAKSGVGKVQNTILINKLGQAWNKLSGSCKT